MKRALLLVVLTLLMPVAAAAQQPAPEISLSVNGGQNVNLYAGWPLIVHATIMNPSRLPQNGPPTQLVIAPTGAAWTTAIQFTATDASGQAHQWPLNLIGTPSNAVLTLAATSYVRFIVQMAPADVSALGPGTYQFTATLQVSNSTGWNGTVQSRPVTIQIAPEPALTAQQQSRKALLIAEYQANAGDFNDALSTVQQLMQSQPSNAFAMSAAANLLELMGYPNLALVQAGQAINAYSQANTSLYDPPANLLAMNQRLFTQAITPNASQSPTSISGSSAEVTFSPVDQTVTLSAMVSSSNAAVNGGTVTFSIAGVGNPVTSSAVTQGTASALFTIPGGTKAGSYPIVASYNGGAMFSASSDSIGALKIDKATPVITWSSPAPITVGTALSSTQLNATANVPGTFAYTPSAGTVLPVGSSETLSAVFTPSDATDYNTVFVSQSLAVNKAVLTVTATSASMASGSAVPSLTYTITGFVNGDTAATATAGTPTETTTATSSSPAGTYPITIAQGTLAAANYTFNFTNGTLTVTPGSGGQPGVFVALVDQGNDSSGNFYIDLRVTNNGTGIAPAISINHFVLRTLAGSGTVVYNAALSPAVPTALGGLSVGSSTMLRVYFNVPPTVTRFSVSESGTVTNGAGAGFSWGSGQVINY